MLNWLNEIFTSKDFYISLGVAGVLLTTGKLWAMLWQLMRQIRQSHQEYSVSGFWMSHCELPSLADGYFVEIWRIVQNRESILLSFFAYHPKSDAVEKHIGSGIFKGSKFSAIYHSTSANSYESGVLALQLKGLKLQGTYAQYDLESDNENFFISSSDFRLCRVQLSLVQSVRIIFGFKPFNSYSEAHSVYRRYVSVQSQNVQLQGNL